MTDLTPRLRPSDIRSNLCAWWLTSPQRISSDTASQKFRVMRVPKRWPGPSPKMCWGFFQNDFFGHYSHKNEEKKSVTNICEKIRRLKTKKSAKHPFCQESALMSEVSLGPPTGVRIARLFVRLCRNLLFSWQNSPKLSIHAVIRVGHNGVGPYPQYGWNFPEEIPERPRKRSQSFSWNSPQKYGWDPPSPIIQGIWRLQSNVRRVSNAALANAALVPSSKIGKYIWGGGQSRKNKSKKPWVFCRRAGIDAALVRMQFVLCGCTHHWK